MTYGNCIKQARETMLLTQEQLAEQLDVSRQAVSKWEADLSRPTREKLDRLSEILYIPPETWAEIDAEAEAAAQPPDTSRPWKIATAALAAVCLVLAVCLAVSLLRKEELPPEEKVLSVEAEPPAVPPAEAEPSPVLPDSIPMICSHDYSFGDWTVGTYDPAAVPFLDDWERVMDSELWCGWFPDGTRLSLVPVTNIWNPAYTNVYLLYAPPAETTDGKLEYHIFYRIGEGYTGTGCGSPDARPFTNVLGCDGFKITMSHADGLYRGSTYIIQGPDGAPRMMSGIGTAATREADVDDDGVPELVTYDSDWAKWQITDTKSGEEGAFVYTLYDEVDVPVPNGYTFSMDPDRGGFLVTDASNTVISRYVLRDDALVRVPATDFTVADYPDVAGTEITFITDCDTIGILTDGLDPDIILSYTPNVRITHRQQAYLALQELYNITGLKMERCYCAANEYGVIFSLLTDGFNQRGFFSCDFNTRYGNTDNIPSLRIAWKELDNDWSPLSLANADRPGSGVKEAADAILWYYDRMKIFSTGETSQVNFEDLWLENGDRYVCSMKDTEYGPALWSITGPYPNGEINH